MTSSKVTLLPIMERPLNGAAIAKALGVGRTYVQAMKKMGFKLRYAGRGTLRDALDWLEKHPRFSQTEAYPRKRPRSMRPTRRKSVSN